MRNIHKALVLLVILASMIISMPNVPAQAQGPYTQPQINKSFADISIKPGSITQLTVTVFNENTFGLINVAWEDIMPVAIIIADPVNLVNTCGGDVDAVAGMSTFSLTDGYVPAKPDPSTPGQCSITIDVTSIVQGNHINTIPIGNLTANDETTGSIDLSNEYEANATLKVDEVKAPSVNKNFSPTTVWTGQASRLEINIFNNEPLGGVTLTETTLTDYLPDDLVLGALRADSLLNCGVSASLVRTPGNDFVTLNNASIAPQTTCRIRVDVISNTQGVHRNTIYAGPAGAGSIQTHQGVTNALDAYADLYVQAIGLTKSFFPSTVGAGDVSLVTITLQNPTGSDWTGVTLTDILPSDMVVAATPGEYNSCGGTFTALAGATSVSLVGGVIPASSAPPTPATCILQFNVTTPAAAAGGNRVNTIGAGDLDTAEGVENLLGTSATLVVRAALTLTKTFLPASIPVGSSSLVTITLRNATAAPITGVYFTDTLPAGLVVADPAGEGNTCGGLVTAVVGASSVSFTGGTIPASPTPSNTNIFGTCTVTFRVSGPAGAYTNTIPSNTVHADRGIYNRSNLASNPTLTITPGAVPVTLTKTFTASTITAGTNTSLRLSILAPGDITLTGFRIVDNLPAGVVITNITSGGAADTPDKSAACIGGTLTAVAGTSVITWESGTINAGTTCVIDVWVTGTIPGAAINTIRPGDITNNEFRTISADRTATLTVTSLRMTKAFFPQAVMPGGQSRLTITLINNTTARLINVNLTDDLATMGGTVPTSGVYIADPANFSTDCGSPTFVAVPGTRLLSITGGTVPPQVGTTAGACTISVDVIGLGGAATRTNTIPILNLIADVEGGATGIRPIAQAQAPLIIGPLEMSVVKGFDPVLVYGGAASTMSVVITNPNSNTALTGIAFTDTMPPGMILADPTNFTYGICGGSFSGDPGDGSFSYSGGTLAPGSSCTLTLRVTMTIAGTYTNTIFAGDVTTDNGVSNPEDAEASLTNLAGASISKGFAPNPIYAGEYSMLTITIRNQSGVGLTGMGLLDTLPAGLAIAGSPAPAPTTDCTGGSLIAVVGLQEIRLSGASLDNSGSCTIVVPVTGSIPSSYLNLIPGGRLISDQGISNPQSTQDTLVVLATASLGDLVWLDTDADGIQDGGESGIDGVTVHLYRPGYGPDGIPGNADDADIAATDVTTGGGLYLFDNLIPGDYYVDFSLPSGYLFSPQDQGADDAADSDADTTTGQTITTTLVSGENDLTWDAGLHQLASLGDLVWIDTDADGIQDGGESGIDGVTVHLYRPGYGPDGIPSNADDADIVTTDVTAGGGLYLFDNLIPGDYYVDFSLPSGYLFSPQDQGADDTADSDADTTTGQTITTTLVSGENDLTWDAGLVQEDPVIEIDKDSTTISITTSGQVVPYTFTVTNTGNVVLTLVTVSDPDCDAAPAYQSGDTNTDNALDLSETWNYTCSHTVSQAEVDAGGDLSNTATVDSFESGPDTDTLDIPVSQTPLIGIAKELVSLTEVSAGTYELVFDMLVRNYGNTSLSAVQVQDDLNTTFPALTTFTVLALTSPDASLDVNPLFDGGSNINLLVGSDTLAVGEEGHLRLTIRLVPASSGPFYNSATGTGISPTNVTVTDISQDGLDPDPGGDGDPTNNNEPTPVAFTSNLFDPPFGIKIFNDDGLPLLQWTMIWINNTNITAVSASVSDPIPAGTTYAMVGASSGYDVPLTAPPGSTNIGVTCTDSSTSTTTTLCYYEVPTLAYPLGRIIWSGTLGPDLGITDPDIALNDLNITFSVTVGSGVRQAYNLATISSDLNGDGDNTDPDEQNVASADSTWNAASVTLLPQTGFAPGMLTSLPPRNSATTYASLGSLWLEIPRLGVPMPIVGVPVLNGKWDVAWLGNNAGWLNGTAYPATPGNTVITGHVYLPNGKPGPFVNLKGLRWGDQIILHIDGFAYTYEVRSTAIVDPDDLSALRHEELPWITLITCQDYQVADNSYAHRTVVRAVLTGVRPDISEPTGTR